MDDDQQGVWEATAAAVAHELATPLAAAQAAVRLLATADDARRQELGEAALRNLHLLDLQIRRLQLLDAVAPEPSRRDVDLAALVHETVEDLRLTTLAEHPTSVRAPDRLIASVDPDQIRQVLFNLLSNAAKFSPAGRDVVVTVEEVADGIVLQVRDRGDGVMPDDAERIFGRYERGEDDRPGAGLGLYLSRRLARAHGGELGLAPASGDGATFELLLPPAGSSTTAAN